MTIPILTTGWHEFRHFYHVTLNPLMSFTYLGNSQFLINFFNGSTPTNEYPRYHRLTTCITRDLTFQLTMLDKYPMNSKLVIFFFFSCTYLFFIYFNFNFNLQFTITAFTSRFRELFTSQKPSKYEIMWIIKHYYSM